MRLTPTTAIAASTLVLLFSGVAQAQVYRTDTNRLFETGSYGGSWPVTVTRSQLHNGTGCLTLSGSTTGTASLIFDSHKYPTGSFLVLDGILMATIIQPEGSQNGALTFVAHARQSTVGTGIFENISGGSAFDVGNLKFGMKNGC